MTICLSVSAGGICRSRNDIISLLFLFLGEEKCEKEIKNDISSFHFSGSSIDVFSAAREETRWFSFLFFSLKSLYLRAFLEMWPCFFLISGREGKWCFFISCKASGYKKASCRGDPQHKASLFTMIFFLFFSPAISDPDAQRECHFEDQREWEGT